MSDVRELTAQAGLLALAAIGYFAVPPGPGRAVLMLAAIVWVPGRCLVVRFGLHRSAGFWAVPLSVLLSFAALIAAALIEYAAFRHITFGPLPLWVGLGALLLNAWRPRPAVARAARGPTVNPWRTGGVFLAATAVSAGVIAGIYHVLPVQQQAGFLQFAYAGQYATLPGVLDASAGQRLTIPFEVAATGEDTAGLTVVAQLDGRQVGPAVPVPLAADASVPGVSGHAVVDLDVAAGCLNRYTFVLERGGTALRTLDLYVSTAGPSAGPSATCRGG